MSGQLGMVNTGMQHSSPQHKLGSIHIDEYGRKWRYGKASGAVAAGKVAQMTKDNTYVFSAMTTTTLNSQKYGLGAPDIDVSDTYYAWFFIGYGVFTIIVANAVAANTALTSTGTAGVLGTGGTALPGVESQALGVTNTRVSVYVQGELAVV